MNLDIEDLGISEIKMPNIEKDHSVDQLKIIDRIINDLNMDTNLSIKKLMKKYKYMFGEIKLLHRYHQLVNENKLFENKELEFKLMKKKSRGHSGVEVIAVSTYPEGKYAGCPANCHYCPKEPEKTFPIKIKTINIIDNFIELQFYSIHDEDKFNIHVLDYIIINDNKIKRINTIMGGKDFTFRFLKSDFNEIPNVNDKLLAHKTAQPRSYLSNEPAVARANQNNWDCVKQFRDIAGKRIMCGHSVTKVEGIVIGGTWSFYPKDYQDKFIRDYYYAANTLYDNLPLRNKLSLEEEIKLNQSTRCRVIGLTLETRPDFITEKEIIQLRKYGCTRVQLGIQHINDDILRYINRGCNHSKSIKAIKLLKDAGFKVDIHLMPDLPSSSFWEDVRMMEHVLKSDELQADQWKIYPCQTLDHTKIKEWYEEGSYKPYFEEKKIINFDNIYIDYFYKLLEKMFVFNIFSFLIILNLTYYFNKFNYIYLSLIPLFFIFIKLILSIYNENYVSNPLFHLLIHFIPKVPVWIRLNRIIRDNPKHKIIGGIDQPHYRNIIEERLRKTKNISRDIREREIKNRTYDPENIKMLIRRYKGSKCDEYFLSIEDIKNDYLLGFLRLRIPEKVNNHYIKELNESALIRELHVYGYMVPQGETDKIVQHRGFGQKLVKRAEEIAKENGFKKIAIISGVGVREYYNKKLDYMLEGTYMTKKFY